MSASRNENLESVVERVRKWPPARQQDVLRLILEMEAQGTNPYALSDEERADLDEALEEIARGEVASEEDVAATFSLGKR